VIGAVAKEHPGRRIDARHALVGQELHHFALRPEHAAQLQQLPPGAVDRADPPGVDDVGDGQRVQAVARAERADQVDVGKALHVEPDLGGAGRLAVDLGEGLAVPLGQLIGAVGDRMDARGRASGAGARAPGGAPGVGLRRCRRR
jgi:hypothetical protein